MPLEKGYYLNGRYQILEILGQGGMGSVYRAQDVNLDVEVAVKENLFTTDEYARQFRREAEILAKLRHPNLPRVTDHFVIEGQGQYLVMDYIEGEDLRQRMDRAGNLSDEDVITIGVAVCEALSYLETRDPPVVHRDIKPGNIKITPNANIFLVDFGLVKTLLDSQITATGARAMTPGYSPPEQYGTARTDQRSDVFSLGATLYAALTGSIPEDSLARAMNQEKLTPIRNYSAQVSKRLASVIEKSLEVMPENRYQSAEEFAEALLSARAPTKRREELLIAPPPMPVPQEQEGEQLEGPAEKPSLSGKTAARITPTSSLNTGFYRKSKRKVPMKRRVQWITVGVILVLIGGILGAAIISRVWIIQPSWAWQLSRMMFLVSQSTPGTTVEWYAPWLGGVTISIAKSTPSDSTSTALPGTATATLTPTQTPSPTIAFTPTPTPTLTMTPTPSASPTPLPTPLGGGGGQIAFASKVGDIPQIFIINVDGTGRTQVTSLQDGACQPDWSPDGTRLVFISPCDGNQEIYGGAALFLINADGSGLSQLPSIFGGDFDPTWSPDGNKIAFTSVRNAGRLEIYVLNLEDQSTSLLSEKFNQDSQPDWSPDGKEILFVSEREGIPQIWVMSPDGTNQRRVTQSGGRINRHPDWSPDQKRILFTQLLTYKAIPQLVLLEYGVEPYQEYRMITGQSPMKDGRFSPDGFWVAYEGWPAGSNHDIYVMTINGSERRPVYADETLDFDPAWKPVP